MADTLAKTRSWIYIVCTVLQTVFAFTALFCVSLWWERKKRKDDLRREERNKELQREENRKAVEALKIADLLSENYDEIKETFLDHKKVEKLKEN